ncbi:hypothetical protein YK48G_03880 [Lentilactobacillus fungorum]|uniref:Cyanophage baseplate Pam3 plug gp18 domain-containing protein n=1 Tax=Lentilactobacillus fungorum TaxID=2201250 RepID=A0ABQ3VVQ4_9LACO|nr:hypothetical protein [Lentilactobacillus fungorum]GHP12963.1 hypothetical protein YK48G_03880 [Lentilactobacillus fungorum]
MPVHDYIPVLPDDMPYEQEIDLDSGNYLFTFQWNETDRVFTVDVSDLEGNLIRGGEVLVLNQPLWRNINVDGLPLETITPLDESGNETELDPGNLGDTIQLCIDDIPDGED